MIRQAGAGLAEVHAAGLLHRDIKPANIMRRVNGQIVLIDFGAAREFSADTIHTQSVILTRGYAPPEQYDPKGKRGPFMDVYALASTLYCLLTGDPPTDGAIRAMEDHLQPPNELRVDVSASLSNAVMRGLNVRIAERTATVEVFLSELKPSDAVIPLLASVPVDHGNLTRGKMPRPVYAPSGPIRQQRLLRTAGAVVAIAVIVSGAWYLGFNQHSHPHRAPITQPYVNSNIVSQINLPPFTPSTKTKVNPVDGSEMIYIPPGEFIMGSDDNEADEKPKHRVNLDGFYIGKNLVTVAQYTMFCSATGRTMPEAPSWGWDKNDSNYPMVNIIWDEAQAYATWAGGSLPTEAQWEKAARGTDGRKYPWGNDWDPAKCRTLESGIRSPNPVGSFPEGTSPYGVLDMAGNVFEWCSDLYDANYYRYQPQLNPPGPDIGDGRRSLRGGSWRDNKDYAPTAFRLYYGAYYRLDWVGFRIVSSVSNR